MILKNLIDKIISELRTIEMIKHVDQDRGQLSNLQGLSIFGTPAVLVRPEILETTSYLGGTQYIQVELVLTVISKDFTKSGQTSYRFYDVVNEIYKKLNNQHFNQLCSPLRRITIEPDFDWKDFNFGQIVFRTNIDDRTIPLANTYQLATPDIKVDTFISVTQSQVTDIYPHQETEE